MVVQKEKRNTIEVFDMLGKPRHDTDSYDTDSHDTEVV